MSGLDPHEVRQLLQDVSERTGLSFHDRHIDQLQATIERAMRRSACGTVAAFRRTLRSAAGAFDDLVGELTVGETYFFRDPRQFELIREEILPELMRRPGVHGSPRLWSAGCSTGEEAYSLAILLEDADAAGSSRVLATDLSRAALQNAREARYREWSLRGNWRSTAIRYLTMSDGRYVLDRRIRQRVTFEYLNLSADVYPSLATDTWGLDLILCRNVLIYFDRQTIERVCGQFLKCLTPGGWLILGASDPHAADFAEFEVIGTRTGPVYRRPEVEHRHRQGMSLPTAVDGRAVPISESKWHAPAPSLSEHIAQPDRSNQQADADRLDAARRAMQNGEHARAAEITSELADREEACVLHVRALAHVSVDDAAQACAEFVKQHRLSAELHYLHAILLMDRARNAEALEQLRRLIFLERSAAIAHFTQGTVFRRLGKTEEARRSFRNARQLCAALPPEELLALGDGETAGRLLEAAHQQLRLADEPAGP